MAEKQMASILAGGAANVVNQAAIIRVFEVLLVLWAAWLIAGIIMQPDGVTVLTSSQSTPSSNESKDALDQVLIRETPLFGVIAAVKATAPVVQATPVAVVTIPPVKVKLWGTVLAGEASVAILAVASDPKQKVFRLHATIADGVTLEQIWGDAVEVNDHSRKRRIELRQPNGLAATPAQAAPTVAHPPRPPGPMLQRSISRGEINRQTRNFSQLLSQARVVPHFSNGKADGFVISDIVPRSLFQQIGLRNGDIIRKVNQTVISSAAQAMQLYQSLQQASEIQLEVERAGQTQTINYHIQ
ncbi:MAG: type II secretion system protein N [Mariprofundaceae bacterium]|nr:type II secretion system protein N [Mariprofundaceae bacterium]